MDKVIAIMDKPKNCQECAFSRCMYSRLLSTYRKGYCCQLLEPNNRVVYDFDYDEEVHINECPLNEIPEKADIKKAKTMTTLTWIEGWNACIDALLKNISLGDKQQ